jgi:glycosyltransferase involved in cell wall biosynthesis
MESIAIALCTCNGERYLDEQLRTLRVQAGVAEIVVADDVSTDGTWAILRRHAAEDGRLRLHRNARRLGVARNFEQVLRLVTCPWVALSDQDDVWVPEKLARMRAAWDGRAGLLHHATHKFCGVAPEALPSPAGQGRKFAGSDVRRLLHRNTVVGHTVLIRTELARELMPFPRGVSHDWWLGVGAAVLDRVQYVDEFLVHYRIHGGNVYHAMGTRWHRMGEEHERRLRMLRVLAGWGRLDTEAAGFVREYGRLLETAERGRVSWALGRFYLRHAAVLFGGGRPVPVIRAWRKSMQAVLAAVCWAAPGASRAGAAGKVATVRPAG